MAFDPKKAKDLAAQLSKAVDSMGKAIPKSGKAPTQKQLEKFTALHQEITASSGELLAALGATAVEPQKVLSAAAPQASATGAAADVSKMVDLTSVDEGAVRSSFDDFFSGVATSFANAQQTLDQRTAEYLAQIKGRPELLPTAFRIAKVSADMKFAVEDVSSTSVGILIFKDTNSTTVQNQQSVHFEMVAAPTPPGANVSSPALPLMLAVANRQRVLDTVKALAGASDTTGSANLLTNPQRTLIFVEDPAKSVYLAVADNAKFGVWRLAIDVPKLTVMRTFGPATGDLDTARNSLFQLSVGQETFLKSIG